MKLNTLGLATAIALATAPNAYAASDYLLEIGGVTGEASTPIEVNSWSFGASNPTSVGSSDMSAGRVAAPRDAASGLATGRRSGDVKLTASQNSQSLRESPSRQSLGFAATEPELRAFTLHFDNASPVLARICMGKHIASAQLRGGGDTFVLENVAISCTETGSDDAARDQMPNRLSMNVTTPKQTQGATFGERCQAGVCTATGVAMTITGQMKHTKTGHVTLLK